MATGVLGWLSLPAASVAVKVMLCGPSRSGCVGVTLQLPSACTTALATGTPLSSTVITSPGVAPLPLKVGVASSVLCPPVTVPVCAPWSSVMTTAAGALGALMSTTKGKSPVAALVSPPICATAVKVCAPSARAVLGVKLQRPLASTVVLPATVPSTLTTMVLAGTPVPLTVGVVSLVRWSFWIAPVMPSTLSLTPVMAGTPGISPRTSKFRSGPGAPMLPAASTGATRMMCAPSASGVSGVKLHARVCGSTVVVPNSTPLSYTRTVSAPTGAVPLNSGRLSSVTPF